jgi:hypothetical protein
MSLVIKYPSPRSFDAQAVMQKAVSREIRRKKAMGQYMVIFNGKNVEKVDFSIKLRKG